MLAFRPMVGLVLFCCCVCAPPLLLDAKTKKKSATDDSPLPPEPLPSASPTPSASPSTKPSPNASPSVAPNASLSTNELADFSAQPAKVQKLIADALELTRQSLTYIYGSAEPENGGLDCSGFIYHVLKENGIDGVPRDASGQYTWVRKAENFEAVLSRKKDSFEMEHLQPGDLLFWTNTYSTDKDPPVTHTMLYLGKEKKSGKRVMVGASDGRSYDGLPRWGVSVFDFKANNNKKPDPQSMKLAPMFVGYAAIPGLRE